MSFVKSIHNNTAITYYILLFSFPLFLLILVESIHRGSLFLFLNWSFNHFTSFISTYFFLLALFSISFILSRKTFIISSVVISSIFVIVAFISYKKHQIRGDFFSPDDFLLVAEATEISKYLGDLISPILLLQVILIICILAFFIWFVFRISVNVTIIKRLIISILGILIFSLFILKPSIFKDNNEDQLDIEGSYKSLGFIGGFTYLVNNKFSADTFYDNDFNMKNMPAELFSYKGEVDTNFQPNVLVILAEAFWDPYLLTNIEFEEDPIPFIRSIMESHYNGELLTHIFGGGTINTEMEILTGLSTRLLSDGSETFNHHLIRPIDSLAHNYKSQGYNTTAIHTYKNWYYNRNKTYEHLGFEKFVSMEFFNNPNYIGPFIDDRELMRQTLSELKLTDGPDFINIATMGSHGPYDDVRYDGDINNIKESDLNDVPAYILNLYMKVLSELDSSIELLIEGINELDEPTMVVIYGDHLPLLGYDYAVYKQAGFIDDFTDYEDYKKMYTTPLVIWDNFSTPNETEELRMTPNFLGSHILEHTKKDKSPIFKVSGDVYNEVTNAIPPIKYFEDEYIDEQKLELYKNIQNDVLFGNQTAYINYPIKVVEDYFLGSEKMVIHDATLVSKNGQKKIELNGSGFVSNAKLFIDDKEVSSNFTDSNHIISGKLQNKNKRVSIQLKLFDDKDNVIASSNKIKTTINK